MSPLPPPPYKVVSNSPTPLAPRATSPTPWEACKGCVSPGSINNKWYFALFALLFLGIVLGIVYFFFHARNGGLKYEPTDWDDYKTIVLRRKTDPEGRTVVSSSRSNASRHNAARLAALSVVATDQKGRKGILAKRGWAGTHSFTYADDFTNYDGKTVADDRHHPPAMSEADGPTPHSKRYHDRDRDDLAAYARESAAKVGGLNRPRDGHVATSSVASSNETPAAGKDKKKAKRVLSEAEKMERRWRREARANAARMAEQAREDSDSRSSPAARRREGEGSYSFSQPNGKSYMESYRPRR